MFEEKGLVTQSSVIPYDYAQSIKHAQKIMIEMCTV